MTVASTRTSPRRRGAAPLLTLAAAAGVAAVAALTPLGTPAEIPERAEGITYQFVVSTDDSDDGFETTGKTLQRTVGRAMVAGTNARIEFAETKGPTAPGMGEDGYMIVRDAGATLVMVNPEKKEYMELEAGALGSMMSAFMGPQGMFKMEVKDPSVSVRRLGAGEPLLGFSTEKWEISQKYTMTVKVMGFGSTTTNDATTTIWFAEDLKAESLMNPWVDATRNLTAMFQGNAEWEEVMMGPSRELPKAASLKTVSRSSITDDKGKTSYHLTTMEVTDWTKGDIPAAMFEVPSDYAKIEMPDLAEASEAMKASGMDTLDLKAAMKNAGYSDQDIAELMKSSAMEGLRQGVKEQTKEEARNATKDAIKRGIGGMFRKKKP